MNLTNRPFVTSHGSATVLFLMICLLFFFFSSFATCFIRRSQAAGWAHHSSMPARRFSYTHWVSSTVICRPLCDVVWLLGGERGSLHSSLVAIRTDSGVRKGVFLSRSASPANRPVLLDVSTAMDASSQGDSCSAPAQLSALHDMLTDAALESEPASFTEATSIEI
ncbi:hypothetical protein V8C34DRAFT_287055 [Trichoderma compactum]